MRASGDRVASGDWFPYPEAARVGPSNVDEGGDAQEAMASTPTTRLLLGVAPHPPSISTPFSFSRLSAPVRRRDPRSLESSPSPPSPSPRRESRPQRSARGFENSRAGAPRIAERRLPNGVSAGGAAAGSARERDRRVRQRELFREARRVQPALGRDRRCCVASVRDHEGGRQGPSEGTQRVLPTGDAGVPVGQQGAREGSVAEGTRARAFDGGGARERGGDHLPRAKHGRGRQRAAHVRPARVTRPGGDRGVAQGVGGVRGARRRRPP